MVVEIVNYRAMVDPYQVLSTEYIVLSMKPAPRRRACRLLRAQALCHAPLRAATAGVAMQFFLRRANRLLGQRLETRVAAKGLLDAAVFEGMKADDRQPAAGLQP